MLKDHTDDELREFIGELLGISPNEVLLPHIDREDEIEDELDILEEFYQENGERTHPIEINWIPKSYKELEAFIELAPHEDMKKMGVEIWERFEDDDKNEVIHYLFPVEWYDHIPKGFPVVDIWGETNPFNKKDYDNKALFGCLAFGFIKYS